MPHVYQNGKQSTPQTKTDRPHVGSTATESTLQRAMQHPASLTSAQVMQLQRTVGNQAVQRMLAGMRSQQRPAQMMINNRAAANKGYVVDNANDTSSNKSGVLTRNDQDNSKMGGEVEFGSLNGNEYGTSMHAVIYDWNHMPEGSSPSVKPSWYPAPNTPYWTSYMVQGHLLNDNVGGPGNDMRNLAPISKTANRQHESWVESKVKTITINDGGAIIYSVSVRQGPPKRSNFSNFFATYPNQEYDDEFDKLPAGFDCFAQDGDGNTVVEEFIENKE